MKLVKNLLCGLCILPLIVSCNIEDSAQGTPPPNFDVLGLWDLVEVNVNIPQDINMDGTASTNLMDELECISGTLLIDGNLVWTFEQSNIEIFTITNGMFAANCTGTISGTGRWFSDESEVTFTGNDALSVLQISGEQLINSTGEDLPGIQSFVYEMRQF